MNINKLDRVSDRIQSLTKEIERCEEQRRQKGASPDLDKELEELKKTLKAQGPSLFPLSCRV